MPERREPPGQGEGEGEGGDAEAIMADSKHKKKAGRNSRKNLKVSKKGPF